MSLGLLFPAALAALASLLLPLLIHLARREQHTPLSFAALRWLHKQARPRQRIRLNEWPLLLVRLLLLCALVLLLARPQLFGSDADTSAVIAIAPALSASSLPATLPADTKRVWLAPGFPPADTDSAPPAPGQPISSLLRELDATLPAGAALSVAVPARLTGTDGQVPQLSRAVDWHVLPVADEQTHATPQAPTPPTLIVRHDAPAQGVAYLRAAQRSWHPQQSPDIATDTHALPALKTDDWVVWLSDKPLPDAVKEHLRTGGGVLLDARQPPPDNALAIARMYARDGTVLIEQMIATDNHSGLLRFTGALQPMQMPLLLEPEFPSQLLHTLQPTAAPDLVEAMDHAPTSGATPGSAAPVELARWLIALIVLMLGLERWLASARNRSAWQ